MLADITISVYVNLGHHVTQKPSCSCTQIFLIILAVLNYFYNISYAKPHC